MNKANNKATIRLEHTGDRDNDWLIDQLELAMLALVRTHKLQPDRNGDIRFELIVDAVMLNMHGEGTGNYADIDNAYKARDRRRRKALKA